jgi:hypothetical protein
MRRRQEGREQSRPSLFLSQDSTDAGSPGRALGCKLVGVKPEVAQLTGNPMSRRKPRSCCSTEAAKPISRTPIRLDNRAVDIPLTKSLRDQGSWFTGVIIYSPNE